MMRKKTQLKKFMMRLKISTRRRSTTSENRIYWPQIGSELAFDGLLAIIFVIIGIMIYLAVRFEWKFSIAAIVANLHDVVIILGFFAAFQWEFSLSVLAAFLLCWVIQ